jgi:hypothetical protein
MSNRTAHVAAALHRTTWDSILTDADKSGYGVSARIVFAWTVALPRLVHLRERYGVHRVSWTLNDAKASFFAASGRHLLKFSVSRELHARRPYRRRRHLAHHPEKLLH